MPVPISEITILPRPDLLKYVPDLCSQIDAELLKPWAHEETRRTIFIQSGRSKDPHFLCSKAEAEAESEELKRVYSKLGWYVKCSSSEISLSRVPVPVREEGWLEGVRS